jgi:hypothetical protein
MYQKSLDGDFFESMHYQCPIPSSHSEDQQNRAIRGTEQRTMLIPKKGYETPS